MKISFSWNVTPCNFLVGTDVLKEITASVFYSEEGRSAFVPNYKAPLPAKQQSA